MSWWNKEGFDVQCERCQVFYPYHMNHACSVDINGGGVFTTACKLKGLQPKPTEPGAECIAWLKTQADKHPQAEELLQFFGYERCDGWIRTGK